MEKSGFQRPESVSVLHDYVRKKSNPLPSLHIPSRILDCVLTAPEMYLPSAPEAFSQDNPVEVAHPLLFYNRTMEFQAR